MKDNYNFSKAKKNSHAGKVKKSVYMNLDSRVIDYFKKMAEETGVPYQNLINFYLLECVKKKMKLQFKSA